MIRCKLTAIHFLLIRTLMRGIRAKFRENPFIFSLVLFMVLYIDVRKVLTDNAFKWHLLSTLQCMRNILLHYCMTLYIHIYICTYYVICMADIAFLECHIIQYFYICIYIRPCVYIYIYVYVFIYMFF